MTSANAVNIIVAAAILESQTQEQLRPTISISGQSQQGQFTLTVGGKQGWNYRVESAPDLKSWNTVTNFLSDQAPKTFPISSAANQQQFYRAVLAQ